MKAYRVIRDLIFISEGRAGYIHNKKVILEPKLTGMTGMIELDYVCDLVPMMNHYGYEEVVRTPIGKLTTGNLNGVSWQRLHPNNKIAVLIREDHVWIVRTSDGKEIASGHAVCEETAITGANREAEKWFSYKSAEPQIACRKGLRWTNTANSMLLAYFNQGSLCLNVSKTTLPVKLQDTVEDIIKMGNAYLTHQGYKIQE